MMRRTDARALVVAGLVCLAWTCACGRAADALELSIDGAAKVGRYEKIQFVIAGALLDKPAVAQGNPFDAADVDLSLEFKAPSGGTLTLPAFYMQPYERREAGGSKDWMYPSAAPGFRARFAPAEMGKYSCKAIRKDKRGTAESASVTFECVDSKRKGYLRVSTVDPRFFEFSDGTPFFAVGQNLAFIGDGQYMKLHKTEEAFGKLAANGANFLRVWCCCEDWAMAIEARKSAWGRSWEKKSPFVDVPDEPGAKAMQLAGGVANVNPAHRVALKPNTKYELSVLAKTDGDATLALVLNGKPLGETIASKDKWTPVARSFTTTADQWWLPRVEVKAANGTAQFRKLSLKEVGSAVELLWEADMDRSVRGSLNQPDCAMLDCIIEAAEKNGLYLELTLVTRDLYMNTLSKDGSPEYTKAVEDVKRLLRYAVARWGWSPSVAFWEYFNEMDPGKPTDRAYREWGEYLDQIDIYHHMRATSAWGPNPKDWRHAKLEQADLHWYLRPTWGELSKDVPAAVLDRVKLLRGTAAARPALLSEFGLADDKWGLSAQMKEDTALLHFHDALWASALSGLSGTALFWWWDQLDKMDAYGHYKPVAAFVKDVPFAAAKLQPMAAKTNAEHLRVIGLSGKSCAYLWLNDARFTWHKVVIEKAAPAEVKDGAVTLEGLEPGAYKVEWWDTLAGKVIKQETAQADAGGLKLAAPAFTRDVACKVTR